MAFKASHIDFSTTGKFSKIVEDYLSGAKTLDAFYEFTTDIPGIKRACEERSKYPVDRKKLVSVLQKQYTSSSVFPELEANIELLAAENCFTICTAHQPNIFTGHLYFIYKIVHVIKLAAELKKVLPQFDFVPVYYMGSEDADLKELGQVHINSKEFTWDTKQTGAVGRMFTDDKLLQIIEEIAAQLNVLPHGSLVMELVKNAYKKGKTIAASTRDFVNSLFGKHGLVVLDADDENLKQSFLPIALKEIENGFSLKAVANTVDQLSKNYKVQAAGRDINLFYLEANQRWRIIKEQKGFTLGETKKNLSTEELQIAFEKNPACISPNVILRPVYQEMILPNIIFTGGGGELAYWLELKEVFKKSNVFFPVLLLRNSFLLFSKKIIQLQEKLGVQDKKIFHTSADLFDQWLGVNGKIDTDLILYKTQLQTLYQSIQVKVGEQDITLVKHVAALQQQALFKIESLEKKLMRATRKKNESTERQIKKLKKNLFPYDTLQERVDNILPWLSNYGLGFIDTLLENSADLPPQFILLKEE